MAVLKHKFPKPPKVTVNITRELIEGSRRGDPGYCMFSQAVKLAHPGARRVESDYHTMRMTDPILPFRYIYKMPRDGQRLQMLFDAGINPDPISFTFRGAQVVAAGRTDPKRALSDAERAARVANGQKSAQRAQYMRAQLKKVHDGRSLPFVAGGKPPTRIRSGDMRHRIFGARAMLSTLLGDPVILEQLKQLMIADQLKKKN